MSWDILYNEALKMAQEDDFIKVTLEKTILSHSSFAQSISYCLANHFASTLVDFDSWNKLFLSAFENNNTYDFTFNPAYNRSIESLPSSPVSTTSSTSPATPSSKLSSKLIKLNTNHGGSVLLEALCLIDLTVIGERDLAFSGLVSPFLYAKGFLALQAHRISHVLWSLNRKHSAIAIQARCSQVFSVDIHPAAIIGEGLFIDHGTGVVIGETARIGRNCTFLHGVTLGSTGKKKKEDESLKNDVKRLKLSTDEKLSISVASQYITENDRHPKLGDDVLVGCSTTILGAIIIENSCKIGSGSIVLKDLPQGATAVGNPARIVGKSLDKSSAESMDLALKDVVTKSGKSYQSTWDVADEGIFI